MRSIFMELYEPEEALRKASAYMKLTFIYTLTAAGTVGVAAGFLHDGLLALTAGLMLLLVPVYRVKAVRKLASARKREIVIELPSFVSTVMLFTGAGDAIPNAILRAYSRKMKASPEASSHPLYRGLAVTAVKLQHNVSFPHAMEDWSRRSGIREIAAFCSAVLLLQKRGGDEFVYAMNEMTRSLWERRRTEARTAGEEAASKLVFPMAVIFVVVMLLVGAPAVLMGMP